MRYSYISALFVILHLFLLHSSYRSISLTEHTIHHYPSLAIQAWEG